MASRKLARDLFLSEHLVLSRHQLLASQHIYSRLPSLQLFPPNRIFFRREFSVFDEFSKKIKGEIDRNREFQQSVKEIKEKAEDLKGVKEDLKARTKQTTEQLYTHVDGVWTQAEEKAKKVKEGFGIGKQESTGCNGTSASHSTNDKDGSKSAFGEEKQQGQQQQSEASDNAETLFSKVKFGVSSMSPKVSLAFQKLKEAKPIDMVKKGYDIVKEELKGNPNRKKHLEYDSSSAAPSPSTQRSTRTDIVVLPSKQSRWSKKWEAFKIKIAEDMRERWETSDHPVVHKIQDISETVLGESDAAMSFKEIRRRDPTFSLPEFVAEVQEVVKPVLNAYFKILHISEVEVRETKMMGETPIIIVAFQTQQVYCIRDRLGTITEGGQDTIHTVYYAWAMQQLDPEELGEGAPYSTWKLREMQQLGVRALI
ncbi:UNVERIFIED_CONTAM: Mitochondrial import inner membrane translocase subunit TIM44-2 [Sesamum indicum]